MENQSELLRQQLKLLKQIRLLLIFVVGSIILPLLITILIAALGGYKILRWLY